MPMKRKPPEPPQPEDFATPQMDLFRGQRPSREFITEVKAASKRQSLAGAIQTDVVAGTVMRLA